jgi:endonuclease YncB( thermonuclease family)
VVDGNRKKIWLQGEMLKRGLAFIYPPTGLEAELEAMLVVEARARRAGEGIWVDDAYADVAADKAY